MAKREKVDYSQVIREIEHHLQHGTGPHPYQSYCEAAEAHESGDAWRALRDIGEAMDRATKGQS
jgi:hypothetical protein